MKCLHGLYDESACAMCKQWPSYDTMRRQFPDLSHDIFLIMTPEERLNAIRTGALNQ